MKKQYSILVLGPSDSFGGFKVDLKQRTCEYILDYVSMVEIYSSSMTQ